MKFTPFGEDVQLPDIEAEYSALCDRRGEIPDYVLSRLHASARHDLYRHRVQEGCVIRTDLERPLRIFLDNGLEFRLVEARKLVTRVLYHVPSWAAGTEGCASMTGETGSAGLPSESLVEMRINGWPEIEDAEMSAHSKIAAIARREAFLQRSEAVVSNADCINASGFTRGKILIALPETTILLNRRHGAGLYWGFVCKRCPEGADWLSAEDGNEDPFRPYLYGGGMSVSETLPAAAQRVSSILAGLPAGRRLGLALRRRVERARLARERRRVISEDSSERARPGLALTGGRQLRR